MGELTAETESGDLFAAIAQDLVRRTPEAQRSAFMQAHAGH
jgi:hypothetical protein